MLKGIGISSIVKLVLAVMVASLFISIATIGALGGALQESFDDIGQLTSFTAEIENEEQFGDLAMFVRDRAVGCEEVDKRHDGEQLDGRPPSGEEGYPGLAHVDHLGQFPSCFGGDASVLRDPWQILPGRGLLDGGPDDNHMRGIYSREQFEITGEAIIEEENTNQWIEKNIAAASGRGYFQHISDQGESEAFSQINTDYKGTGRNYVYFLPSEIASDRTNLLLEDDFPNFEDRVWFCGGDNWNCDENPLTDAVEGVNMEVALCPGDEGYIQMNTRVPEEESGLGDADGSSDYYPRIVIEDYDTSSCGDIGGRGSLVPESARTSGRMLHILSDTTEDYPYIGERLRTPNPFSSLDYASLNFVSHNEDNEFSFSGSDVIGTSPRHSFDSDRSDKCIIGLYDHTSGTYDETGWVAIDQGEIIEYDDKFPDRSQSAVYDYDLGHSDDRPPGQTPRSARNLYDMLADDNDDLSDGGFTSQSSGFGHSTNLIYDNHAGIERFELYGDLLCGEHSENHNFASDHGEWHMCGADYSDRTVNANGQEWECDSDNGRWSMN